MVISESLSKWYAENRRSLPWRRNRDPYFIWISEIMLQQTTVAAVKPYFERFIKVFPTVKALASASEEEVLSQWSGLGYYSRARNLQRAAREIIKLDVFPQTSSQLLELPGIGPYTAAAIASIAFGEEIAAIDGNVVRVISRLYNIESEVTLKQTVEKIRGHAAELLQGQNPSNHNQAMMELGATLCLPKNPKCLICPVQKFCKAFKAGTVLERPIKKKKRAQEPWLWEMFLIRDQKNRIALVKNENGTPWLNHLWVLPGKARPWKKVKNPIFNFQHSITHHKIFVSLKKRDSSKMKNLRNTLWIREKDLEKVGVSSIVQKALRTLSAICLIFYLGCKSPDQKVNETEVRPTPPPHSSVVPITKSGENQMGRFSPDGTKIIFQSANRPAHKRSQIYILNLKTGREHRITYNDGDDSYPAFDPTGSKVLYTSTTDEIKEHADVSMPVTESLVELKAPYDELYESQADGSHIGRLTKSVGFDGNGIYSSDGSRILFVSQRDGNFKIYLMDRHFHKPYPLTKNSDFEYAPAFSPKGRTIAYETHSLNSSAVHISTVDFYGKNPVVLTSGDGINRDPAWFPDDSKIIFSSNQDDPKTFHLFMVTLDGKCLKRLTTGSQIDLYPSFSTDGKQIIYTSNKSGTYQIYIVDFDEPKDCLPVQP